MSTQSGFETTLLKAFQRVTTTALGPYQTAIVRIGIASSWVLFLLREWPNRHELYGPRGPLSWDMAVTRVDANDAFTVLVWSDGALWFEVGYHFAILAGIAFALGWRTRAASVLFMIGVFSVQNRNSFIGDGGDNVFHLMAVYLVATRCGQVWSLDARRARRQGHQDRDVQGAVLWSALAVAYLLALSAGHLTWGWSAVFGTLLVVHAGWWLVRRYAPGEPRQVCDIAANLVHNGAVLVIIGQMCLLYASAGWYKIQGSRWQDGTAAYYPMHVDVFRPWPFLSDVVSSQALPILLMTYGTVIVQVAFPFTLFNRRVKNFMLALLIAEHAGIAVLLGLPFFSLAVIAADLIFLPTSFLRRIEGRVLRLIRGRAPDEPATHERPEETEPLAYPELWSSRQDLHSAGQFVYRTHRR